MTVTLSPYAEHAQAKRNLAQAQQEILAALRLAWPSFYEDPPKKELNSMQCAQMSTRQIDNGVRAFMLACNLAGASAGNFFNLYELMQVYIRDLDAREAMNEVIRESRLREQALLRLAAQRGRE